MKTGRQIYRFLPTSFFVLRILDSFVFLESVVSRKNIGIPFLPFQLEKKGSPFQNIYDERVN